MRDAGRWRDAGHGGRSGVSVRHGMRLLATRRAAHHDSHLPRRSAAPQPHMPRCPQPAASLPSARSVSCSSSPSARRRGRPRRASDICSTSRARGRGTTRSTAASACSCSTSTRATGSCGGFPPGPSSTGSTAENVKGIAASARTGRVYVTSLTHVIAIDAVTGKTIWDRPYDGGTDRLAISPDGRDAVRAAVRGAVVARRRRRERRRARHDRDALRLAQHDLRRRRKARVPRRPQVRDALGGGPGAAARDERRRTVRQRHPSLHRERRRHAGVRERERPARLRGRRSAHGQGAAPRRGHRATRRGR